MRGGADDLLTGIKDILKQRLRRPGQTLSFQSSDMPDADPKLWVRTEELARVITFLLSDEASCVTGASVPVMGRV